MRIRKRKVPLPLSLLSPVPLSDPHLFSRSPVTVQQLPSHPNTPLLPQPSDHLPLTSSHSSASDLRRRFIVEDTTTTAVKEQLFCWKQESNDASNGKMGARPPPDDDDNGSLAQMSSQVLVPLKKEKMIFLQKDEHDHDYDHDHRGGGSGEAKKGIRKSRGSTIMEGSRCSRVNGRGWRCCQPTLVGYSLCEHHLGKGRLRSMTTVRGRPSKAAPPPLPPLRPLPQLQNNEAKRVKLGVVKARSLSSLLGQTTNTTSIINVDNGVAAVEINVNHGNNNDLIKDKP